jgi:hypothetical protein
VGVLHAILLLLIGPTAGLLIGRRPQAERLHAIEEQQPV